MRLQELYKTRQEEWNRTTIRYIKLVSNSGFMFSLYVALIIGGVYYQKALKTLPPHFPAAIILAVLFGLFVIPTSIRTFIQRADLIFLLPAESELSDYFRKAIRNSWIRQSIILIFVAAIAMPLYLKTLDSLPSHYGFVVVLLILLKGWNIFGVWCESRLQSSLGYLLLRGLLSLVFIYFVLVKAPLLYLGVILLVLLGVTFWGYAPILKKETLNWIHLAEEEARLAMRFFRIANWVTDVPGLVQPVRPRRYLDFIYVLFKRSQDKVYPLLYLKTFVRTGDYFGLYGRLTIIGGLLMVLVKSSSLFPLITFGLIVFLTAFQLLALSKHDFPQALEGLYPIDFSKRRVGFLKVIRLLTFFQIVLLSIVFLLTHWVWLTFLIMMVIGILFIAFWVQFISRKLVVQD